MSQQLIRECSKKYFSKNIPVLKTGHTVKVYQKIKEGNKERIQIFEGLVIAIKGGTGINGTITVRKVIDGYGVEKIFPIHSKNIEKIEVTKEAKVRRSKLYYMRDRSGKSARLQEKHVKHTDIKTLEELEEEKLRKRGIRKTEEKKEGNENDTEVSKKIEEENSNTESIEEKKEDTESIEEKKEDTESIEEKKEDTESIEEKKEDTESIEEKKEDTESTEKNKE